MIGNLKDKPLAQSNDARVSIRPDSTVFAVKNAARIQSACLQLTRAAATKPAFTVDRRRLATSQTETHGG